jgi:hypothetical protein
MSGSPSGKTTARPKPASSTTWPNPTAAKDDKEEVQEGGEPMEYWSPLEF